MGVAWLLSEVEACNAHMKHQFNNLRFSVPINDGKIARMFMRIARIIARIARLCFVYYANNQTNTV